MTFRAGYWYWLALFLIFSGLGSLVAQSLPYRRLIVDKVGETSLGTLYDLTEDARGFLWIGGTHSLYKYDGTNLELFNDKPDDSTSIVPGAYVQVRKCRKSDGIWIGSNTGGLSYLDLRTEKARNFTADSGIPGSLAGNEIAGLYEDADGGLWVGTNQFTLHYLSPVAGQRHFQRFRPKIPVDGSMDYTTAGLLGEIIPDVKNPDLLWVGSRYGVYRFNRRDTSFHLFPFSQVVPYFYRQVNLQMFMDARGYIWCGTAFTGLCRLDPATGRWDVYKKEGQAFASHNINNIQDITLLNDSALLILTTVDDAWTMPLKGGKPSFHSISPLNGVGLSQALTAALKTRDGDIWISSNDGLIRLTKKSVLWPFVFFPGRNPALDKNNWQRAYAISPDRRQLYIGTLRGNGLLTYDLENGNMSALPYRKPESPEGSDVLMDALCFDAGGRLWIGSDTGLLYLNAGERLINRFAGSGPDFSALSEAQVSALFIRGDTLWVGTKGRGAFFIDMSTSEVRQVETGKLSKTSTVNTIQGDAKYIWLGHDRGLSAYDPAGKSTRHFDRYSPPPLGLSNDQVTALAYDAAGHLWVSTLGGGMLRLRNGNPQQPCFEPYYNNEVPGGNVVYDFVICDRGQLWLGTQSGLAVLDTGSRTFVNYDIRDGMFAKIGSMIRVPDGRIASGAYRGFHFFHPDSVLYAGRPPVPYLKHFRIFDREVDLPTQVDRMESLTLAYDQNHFSFEIGALNFDENARTHYAYQLVGYDKDWVYSGARNYLSYNNLPAGHYTLRVKASNKHGIWSEQDKTIPIVIRPPYWQTLWFRLLVLSVVTVLAGGMYHAWRQRQRTLQAQGIVEYFANTDYQGTDVRDILWDVAHKCMSRLHLEDCVIYLLDESGEHLVQEAAYSLKSSRPGDLSEALRIPLGQGIVGVAGLKARPEMVNDTRRDPRYIVDEKPRLSELAVPILHDGRLIGVIDSEHSRRNFFTDYHLQVLKTIASLCAGKIAQAQAKELMQEKERQLRELNRNLAESQLTALRAQMNPHFLFNCLNSINWYIIKNRPAEASRYIARFSRLIRLILDHSKDRQITLARELEALRLYLDMEAMRFEHRFEYSIDLSPDLDPEDVMVPPLIFQPYVENAIWHGLMPKNAPGHLRLSLRAEVDVVVCTIEDDGIGRAAAAAQRDHATVKRQSQGLKITEARIRQLGGQSNGNTDPVRFTDLYDSDGVAAGTRVEVRVG